MDRHLAAILAADIVGYSRLMGADETDAFERLNAHLDNLIKPQIADHGGRIVKLMGDGILAEFSSVVEAVECAIEIQQGMKKRNAGFTAETAMLLRIGINLGDVIMQDGDIFGDGVNVAARLEALAPAGGVCISRAARDQVQDKLSYALNDLGEHKVKNIARPVHAFQVVWDGSAPKRPPALRKPGALQIPVVLAAGAVLAVAIVGLAFWQFAPGQPDTPSAPVVKTAASTDVPSLAVLPFDNLSSDPEQAFFADGLTEDLITDLSKISGLFVIARNSVFTYKGKAVNVQQVSRELNVGYVLEGSVRRAGNKVRINAQLIDGSTGHHVWAERFDRDQSDIFAMQDEVISKITSALAVKLTDSEAARLARIPTSNLEAYDLYLQAEAIFEENPQAIAKALRLYAAAIERDPAFAEAHAGYARAALTVWLGDYNNILPGAVARKRAYDAAGKALKLDGDNARAYAVLSLIQLVGGRRDQAVASARQAIALNPNDSHARANLAVILAYAGQLDQAKIAVEAALERDPSPDAAILQSAGTVYYWAGEYVRAIEYLSKASQLSPNGETISEFLAAAYAHNGDDKRASERIDHLRQTFPHVSLAYFEQFYQNTLRETDRKHHVDALKRAGLTRWPYGFQPREVDRVGSEELPSLVIDRTWSGKLLGGGAFFQTIDAQGRLAYRSRNSVVTGKVQLYHDQVCQLIDGYFRGRKLCGRIYRLPHGTAGDAFKYVYVGPDSVKTFSLAQAN